MTAEKGVPALYARWSLNNLSWQRDLDAPTCACKKWGLVQVEPLIASFSEY